MKTALLLSDDELTVKATRLVNASAKNSFDPFTEIDWSVPFDLEHGYYLPPEDLPLFGTSHWSDMTEAERVDYSRHEFASLCGSGIFFENVLMQLLLKHLYKLPATDGSHRFLLVETADECRHSSMFGEVIRRADTPSYRVPGWMRLLGRFFLATASAPEGYLGILAAEELLDASNRRTMNDERIHPISRSVARIHVAEEARHISYAREFVEKAWPKASRLSKIRTRQRAPFLVGAIVWATVNPTVYQAIGRPDAYAAARNSAFYRQRAVTDMARLTTLLSEVEVITRGNRWLWRRLGLVQ